MYLGRILNGYTNDKVTENSRPTRGLTRDRESLENWSFILGTTVDINVQQVFFWFSWLLYYVVISLYHIFFVTENFSNIPKKKKKKSAFSESHIVYWFSYFLQASYC